MKHTMFSRWQANFWAGLAIALPGIISVAAIVWLFGAVAVITDTLLFFLPHTLTHRDHGNGPMYWYWSLVALLLAIFLIGAVGVLARNYFGQKLIEWVDSGLLRVPLLNKIYSATKQVNDAFSATNKTAFRTVVLVEFPKAGTYSIGFITNDQPAKVEDVLKQKMVCVFVPTTPNPTAGFLLVVPVEQVVKLNMSVAEGIKYVISLGSIVPELPAPANMPALSQSQPQPVAHD